MPTVQSQLLKLAQRVDPRTKSDQVFTDASAAVNIASSTNATPIVVTTSTPHGRSSGDQVYITGHLVNTNANNTGTAPNWYISVQSSTTFALYSDSALSVAVAGNGVGVATGTVTSGLIGSIDGSRFTRQRLLDVYNDARLNILAVIAETYPMHRKALEFSGTLVKITNLQFTTGVANKPTGYIAAVYLTDVNNNPIPVLPYSVAPMIRANESSTIRFVLESGSTFVTLTGATNIPDASTYILVYYGLTNFTLAQVLDGTTTETLNDDLQTIIIEIAEAIANDVQQVSVNQLTKTLLDNLYKTSQGVSA
jgi:hypothetical protein